MAAVSQWVQNIACYLIFTTVIINILPGKKYEKYLRLFAGMVLILLVLQPLTGALRLEDKITYYFETFTFQNDAASLEMELLGAEETRREMVIHQYEGAVAIDLENMARETGLYPGKTEVEIESDSQSPEFGKVKSVKLWVSMTEQMTDAVTEITAVEPVVVGEKRTKIREKQNGEDRAVSSLRKQIADYYDLEAADVWIQLE